MSRFVRMAGVAGALTLAFLAGTPAGAAPLGPCTVGSPASGQVQVDECGGAECVGAEPSVGVEGGTASVRLYGPGPGSCVLLCLWRFDVRSGTWELDCPWAAF